MSSNTGEESAKSNHKVARKQWRNNDMEDAMKAVVERTRRSVEHRTRALMAFGEVN